MIERPHIICSNAPIVTAGGGVQGLRLPGNLPDWHTYCDSIAYTIAITGVDGAPTAWSLTAKFQLAIPHVSGAQFGSLAWGDLQTEQATKIIDEGVGWYGFAHAAPVGGAAGTLADQADGTPTTTVPLGPFSRVIKPGGRRTSVLLAVSFTAGTTPALRITATATPLARA